MAVYEKKNDKWVDVGGIPPATVEQDTAGIKVGGTALQDATGTQNGLMTKEQVAAIGGKLNKTNGVAEYGSTPYVNQVGNRIISTREPTPDDGVDGDMWIFIEE